MTPLYKKYLMIMMFVLLSLGITHDMAFFVPITIDAMEYASQYQGEEAYPRIVDIDNLPHPVSADAADWNSKSDVDSFPSVINSPYWIQEDSVGNIWSSDQFVTDSPSGFYAEIYRIALLDGAFERDSFNWSNWQGWGNSTDYILGTPSSDSSNGGYDTPEEAFKAVSGYDLDLNRAEGGSLGNSTDYILGTPSSDSSNGGYFTLDEAFNAGNGHDLDLNIVEGGSLNFWIKNFNSIDNLENFVFDVAKVPEPATILLLCLGLMGIQGIRRFIK